MQFRRELHVPEERESGGFSCAGSSISSRSRLATGVQLEVRASNTRAQRFYRRLGYKEVFEIDGYYSDGEDALVMMKWFRF